MVTPELLTNSAKLPLKPFLASYNHLEKNQSLPLNNIGKESNWPNKPRIRSFTTSEGIDRKSSISKNKGSLSRMNISSSNVAEPIKEKFLQGNRNYTHKILILNYATVLFIMILLYYIEFLYL